MAKQKNLLLILGAAVLVVVLFVTASVMILQESPEGLGQAAAQVGNPNDLDGDKFKNNVDNCPKVYNPDQLNTDKDKFGDACDDDDDGDKVDDYDSKGNPLDNCRLVPNPKQEDTEKNPDSTPNPDGVGDACDNCLKHYNPNQENVDGDKYGDVCDEDIDGDEIPNKGDLCPETFGLKEYKGCPVADKNEVFRQVDLANGDSTRKPLEGAVVEVFDRNLLNGLTITTLDGDKVELTKNPDGSLGDDIFESVRAEKEAKVGECVTDGKGVCYVYENGVGDYLIVVKYIDEKYKQVVYTSLPKSPEDFKKIDINNDKIGDQAYKVFNFFIDEVDRGFLYRAGERTIVRKLVK